MKISELSDQDCSRWICEKLEPLNQAKIHRINGHTYSNLWDAGEGWDGMPSADKFQPRDMVSDPAMTVMLMEQLRRLGLIQIGMDHLILLCAMSDRRIRIDNNDTSKVLNLGRAVAEAFMLTNGWTDRFGTLL